MSAAVPTVAIVGGGHHGLVAAALLARAGHCVRLFERAELTRAFSGWDMVSSEYADFEAPRDTLKRFHTVIARRPK